eukprot:6198773-Pleurochrysis_carterae.AAC.1
MCTRTPVSTCLDVRICQRTRMRVGARAHVGGRARVRARPSTRKHQLRALAGLPCFVSFTTHARARA